MASGAWSRRFWLASALGSLAALAALSTGASSARLEAGSAAWRRLVRGAELDGRVRGRATVLLPGLPRARPGRLSIELVPANRPSLVSLSIDGGPLYPLRADRQGMAVAALPRSAVPGLRLDLLPAIGQAELRIRSLAIDTGPPSRLLPALAFFLAGGVTFLVARRQAPALAVSFGLVASGLLSLAFAPAFLFLTLPLPASFLRLLSGPLLLAASLLVVRRASPADSQYYWRGSLLLAALVFGTWVRLAFLPSAGSWDTEYWKAWMIRAVAQGTARVYGDPGSVPAGHFLAQLSGREELWRIERHGREFVVDYPPLAMALWRWSWFAVRWAAPGLDLAETENAAVKLPAVLGDVGAVLVLLWTFGPSSRRGVALAALYWALPISWLSSAVLGFLDGASAPLAAASLVFAGGAGGTEGTGRAGRASPVLAGVLLALACLVKPTAVVIAPAVAVAVMAAGKPLWRAIGAGAAAVALVSLPFVLAGSLAPAVVHVYRILFQQRLSGGYSNLWWIVGHLAMLREGTAELGGPVKYALLATVPFPARTAGAALFALAAVFVALRHRRRAGPGPAALAGAALFLSYSMLAIGVHENHAHPLFLILLATGLGSPILKLTGALGSTSYVLNMLALSGIGRLYGQRYLALEPFSRALLGLRMALGLDLTLVLAAVNLAVFVALLVSLKKEMARLSSAVVDRAAPGH